MAAYYNEIDEFAAQWLRNLIAAGLLPPGDVDSRSILDIQPEDLNGYEQCHFFAGIGIWGYALRRVGWQDDSPIWSGSCPCQPFSAAGRGLGFNDERHLWPAWFHLITQRNPSKIVGEQVASKDGLEWFDLVSTDLESAGYAVGAGDLCAAGFAEQGRDGGGFHLRQRLYFVATGDGLADGFSSRAELLPRNYGETIGFSRETGASDGPALFRGDGGSSGLGDAGNERRRETGGGRPVSGQWPCETGQPIGLGDSERPGLEGHGGSSPFDDSQERGGAYRQDSVRREHSGLGDSRGQHGVSDNDARRPNANLVYCRDGRWRPIEPESLPLAYAVPRAMGAMRAELRAVCLAAGFSERDLTAARKYRSGVLKGFGNALDAETVVAFLEAALPLAP